MLSPLSEKIVVHLVDNKVNSLVIDADLYDKIPYDFASLE